MSKLSFSGSGAFGPETFHPRLRTYLVANDGATDLVVGLDEQRFTLAAGETLTSVSGETLGQFRVVSGGAWRFLADA